MDYLDIICALAVRFDDIPPSCVTRLGFQHRYENY